MGAILIRPWFFLILTTLLSQLWITMFSVLKYVESLLSFSPLLSYFELQYTYQDRKNPEEWCNTKRVWSAPSQNSNTFTKSFPNIKTGAKPAWHPLGRLTWCLLVIDNCSETWVCFTCSIWADCGCIKYVGKVVSSSWFRAELQKGEISW